MNSNFTMVRHPTMLGFLSLLLIGWSPIGVVVVVVVGFSPLSFHRQRGQQLPLHVSSSSDGARAGSGGYSVLRQPVNWDATQDPVFEAPTSLIVNDNDRTLLQNDAATVDMDWWTERKQSKQQQQARQQTMTKNTVDDDEQKDAPVDLFQRSLDTLDFPRVLQALLQDCTTIPARLIVQEAMQVETAKDSKTKTLSRKKKKNSTVDRLAADSAVGCQERYGAVEELDWILSDTGHRATFRNRRGYQQEIRGCSFPFLGKSSFPLQPLLEAGDQVLEGEEVMLVADMLDCMEDTQLWGRAVETMEDVNHNFTYLPSLAVSIEVNSTLQEILHGAFDKDGRLNGDTFPTIGRLRALLRSLKSDVLDTINAFIPSVRSKMAVESGGPLYSEISGGRLVIPVDPKYASSIGLVHDRSRSGKTVYVEPTEIVAPTNELRQTESELQAEESRIWRFLTEQILCNREALEKSVSVIAQLDLVSARLSLGRKLQGVIPKVKDEGMIHLVNAKHPILLLREIPEIVGSDISFGEGINQGLVLTGPNAGGKTVILKLLGLVALMARSGIPIPAERGGSSIPPPRVDFFNPILADIGDIQTVGGDLSTFSGHMLVCREVLENAGRNTLVLMDEISSGTDPNQGVAIAQALLEAVVDAGAKVAITTHYMQLKQLAASDERFSVAGMQFVNGRPTYKLQQGIVGESFALSVAERLGLPDTVIERANALLDSETRQMGDLIREMEDQKALIDKEATELQAKKKEVRRMEFKLKEDQIRLENKQLEARRKEARKFAKILEEKEARLENILDRLKNDPSRRIVAKSWGDIKLVRREALDEAENTPSKIAQKKRAADAIAKASSELIPISEMTVKPELKEGDFLIVRQRGSMFGKQAAVVNSSRNRVNVRIGNMNLNLKFSDVAIPAANSSVRKEKIGGRSNMSKATRRAIEQEATSSTGASSTPTSTRGVTIRTQSNTVDVRGCNLIDAQEKIRSKFSSCLMSNQSVVYILHGHGSGGVLKSKIRGWLKNLKSAKKHSPADAADGGDAFTRVSLR